MNTTKLKLTNPTDDELSAAVAEHVAGWHNLKLGVYGAGAPERPDSWHGTPPNRKTGIWPVPRFTHSADAVLPLLEKWHDANGQTRDVRICRRLAGDWLVILRTRDNAWDDWSDTFEEDGELPRAACIALLRANGIEVEQTATHSRK